MVKIVHRGSLDRAWDLYGCDRRVITSAHLGRSLHARIRRSGFTTVGYKFKKFNCGGCGISFAEVIEESHVTLHSSPEIDDCVELTIHICDIEGTGAKLSAFDRSEQLYRHCFTLLRPTRIFAFDERRRAARSLVGGHWLKTSVVEVA